MSKKFNAKNFWQSAIMRAIRSMAQAMIASIGATAMITDINWGVVMGTAVTTGLLSILNSIVTGLPEAPLQEE